MDMDIFGEINNLPPELLVVPTYVRSVGSQLRVRYSGN